MLLGISSIEARHQDHAALPQRSVRELPTGIFCRALNTLHALASHAGEQKMDGLVSRCSLIIFTFWSSCSTKAGTAGANFGGKRPSSPSVGIIVIFNQNPKQGATFHTRVVPEEILLPSPEEIEVSFKPKFRHHDGQKACGNRAGLGITLLLPPIIGGIKGIKAIGGMKWL